METAPKTRGSSSDGRGCNDGCEWMLIERMHVSRMRERGTLGHASKNGRKQQMDADEMTDAVGVGWGSSGYTGWAWMET